MTSPAPQAPAPRARGGKSLGILAAAVLTLAVAGVVGYTRFARGSAAPAGPAPLAPVVVVPAVVDLEPFVVRLADPTGDRYFRLNVQVVLDQQPIAARAGTGLGRVKLVDLVLALLAKKRARELVTVAGKEALRAELQTEITGLLAEEPLYDPAVDPAPAAVLDVLFTEFLVQ